MPSGLHQGCLPGCRSSSYLVFGMRLEEKNINDVELVHKAVFLEFLAHAGSKSGDGERHVVHGLNFRSLKVEKVRFSLSLHFRP